MWNEVQSCLVWPGGQVAFLFSGHEYVRFNIKENTVDGGPMPIEGNWPGLWSPAGAGIMWPGDKYVYFLRGQEYMRFNIEENHVDKGYPLPIADHWPGFSLSRVDAGLVWPNGMAYFFGQSGTGFGQTVYIRYNIAENHQDRGYPLPILPHWPGLTIPINSTISAATVWPGNTVAYLLFGNEYSRYNIADNHVDDGYPMAIAGNWPGVPITEPVPGPTPH